MSSHSATKSNNGGTGFGEAIEQLIGLSIGGVALLVVCCIIIPICCCFMRKSLCFKDCGRSGSNRSK